MKRHIIIYLFFTGLVVNFACTADTCCEGFRNLFDSLYKTTVNFPALRNENTLDNKHRLFSRLCPKLKNEKRLLILERTSVEHGEVQGLIYLYGANEEITFIETDEDTKITYGPDPDIGGRLSKLADEIMNDPIKSLSSILLNKQHVTDRVLLRVYYFDLDLKTCRLFY